MENQTQDYDQFENEVEEKKDSSKDLELFEPFTIDMSLAPSFD